MYNPRSNKQRKLNSPFPFPSYVIKSYSTQTPQSLKGLKINSHKIQHDIQNIQKNQRINNKSQNSHQIIKKNNHSSQILDQIYSMIHPHNFQPKKSSIEKQFKQKIKLVNKNNIKQQYNHYLANVQELIWKEQQKQLQMQTQVQSAMDSLNYSGNNNRKNIYRTRQHKHKSMSPTKKLSKVVAPEVIASFRYALVSLYVLLNRREDYFNVLKNKQVQSLYPPLKNQQIQELFKKYIQTKGRDKGRTKYNYLTSQQLRSIKYKSGSSNKMTTTQKKQKKEKINEDQEQSEEQIPDGEEKPELIDFATWKRKNGVGQNQKVFIVKGGYADLRKTLVEKNWFQNDDVYSPYFDFKWTTKICDIDYMNLRPHQSHLTSKYGITRRLKTLYLSHQIDIDRFYPRCYDLADLVDFENFIENFKFGFAETVAKRFIVDKKRYQKLQLKVRISYEILKRRNTPFRSLVNDINKSGVHFITPDEWQILTQIADLKSQFFIENLNNLRKKQSSIISNNIQTLLSTTKSLSEQEKLSLPAEQLNQKLIYEKLHEGIESQLIKLSKNQPQLEMNGYRNVWIAKPNFLSRGRGIRCYNNLYDIVTYCCGGTGQFVIQKYIQNPLLIGGKKFDIRQWVLIQDYNPPKIWFYDECYIRFCADDYSLDNIHNRFQHLTNNSIQKYNKNLVVDKSMWEKSQFIEFVGKQKWEEIVEAIKNIVVWTIKSCQGFVNGRKGSCELVGYDFMIDENLNPWLIQINMSPSMQYSTPVTKKLVKMVLQDTAKVLSSNKKSNQVGGFKCIYKGNQDIKKFQKYKIV